MSPPEEKSPSILIVDDEPQLCDALCRFLVMEGWSPSASENGREALELLATGYRPAVILTDQEMPIMDGRLLLGALREDPGLAGIPVVRMSASPWFDEGTLLLAKPFSKDELMMALESVTTQAR